MNAGVVRAVAARNSAALDRLAMDRVALELLGADALRDDETYDAIFLRELSHRQYVSGSNADNH